MYLLLESTLARERSSVNRLLKKRVGGVASAAGSDATSRDEGYAGHDTRIHFSAAC